MPGANKYLSLIVFFQREEMSECVNRVSIFTVSSFLWRHPSRKSIYQTLEGASERRWVPSRGILQSWSAGVLERSSSAIVHDTNTHAQRRSSHSPRFRRRACARLENLWFSLNGSFLRLFIRWLPSSPKRWRKRGRKEGIYARGNVINRGSGIGEKEARAQHRRKSSTSVHLPILYLDDVCVEWIGDPGSRWILWPFHRLSCGIRLVPVHLLLSFLTERIPPAARPIPSGGRGSPFLASVQLPLFILLPPREWKN